MATAGRRAERRSATMQECTVAIADDLLRRKPLQRYIMSTCTSHWPSSTITDNYITIIIMRTFASTTMMAIMLWYECYRAMSTRARLPADPHGPVLVYMITYWCCGANASTTATAYH